MYWSRTFKSAKHHMLSDDVFVGGSKCGLSCLSNIPNIPLYRSYKIIVRLCAAEIYIHVTLRNLHYRGLLNQTNYFIVD